MLTLPSRAGGHRPRLVAVGQRNGKGGGQCLVIQARAAPSGAQEIEADLFEIVAKTRVAAACAQQVTAVAVAARIAQYIRLAEQIVARRKGRLRLVRFSCIALADMADAAAIRQHFIESGDFI